MKDKHLWHIQLVKFLGDGVLPINLTKLDKKLFKLKASHFCMLGGILYRRGLDEILLRCLQWVDYQIVISCAHDGICEGYFNGPAITKCLIRVGYYWPIMKHDCIKYVNKCVKYQQNAKLFNQQS